MKRLLLLLGLLALPVAAAAQPDGWQTVVAPDLRCRIEMPAPVANSIAEEKEKGHATPRLAWESKRGEDMFDFDYVDYDPSWFAGRDTKEIVRDLGRGEAEKAFPPATYKYIRDELIALQGWDGYALDIQDAAGSVVMMRTYMVRDRLYRLLVTAKPDLRSRSAALRFVESLRLAESKQ